MEKLIIASIIILASSAAFANEWAHDPSKDPSYQLNQAVDRQNILNLPTHSIVIGKSGALSCNSVQELQLAYSGQIQVLLQAGRCVSVRGGLTAPVTNRDFGKVGGVVIHEVVGKSAQGTIDYGYMVLLDDKAAQQEIKVNKKEIQKQTPVKVEPTIEPVSEHKTLQFFSLKIVSRQLICVDAYSLKQYMANHDVLRQLVSNGNCEVPTIGESIEVLNEVVEYDLDKKNPTVRDIIQIGYNNGKRFSFRGILGLEISEETIIEEM